MRTSAKGRLEIISHEAIVLCPYKDSVGIWTVGIGHTAGAGLPHPAEMPKGVASAIPDILAVFSKDLAKFEDRVNKAFTRPLTQAQFDAAVSFDFNTGKIDSASWVREFNAGNLAAVGPDMMIWRIPSSIIARRQAECDLFLKGKYSSDGYANVYTADAAGHVLWSKGKRTYVAGLLSAADKAAASPSAPVPAAPVSPQPASPAPVSPVPVPTAAQAAKHAPLVLAGGALIVALWERIQDSVLTFIHHIERLLP